jgi:hypothetical protein
MISSTANSKPLRTLLHRERHAVEITRYRVGIPGLPRPFHGFTILHLSDLHDKEFGPGGSLLLERLRGESFDLVALTGDLVLGPQYRLTPALDLVHALKDVPVYSVSGNHDWGENGKDWGLGERIKRQLGEAGARVLSNESVPLEREGSRLWLVGVDDPVTGKDQLERALAQVPEHAPRLVLAHSPQLFPQAVRHEVDLLLTGHTHGGQIRFPYLGAAYVPALGFFPRFDYGCFSHGRTSMVVNAGLGESWLPIRWNIPPEAALITLAPD